MGFPASSKTASSISVSAWLGEWATKYQANTECNFLSLRTATQRYSHVRILLLTHPRSAPVEIPSGPRVPPPGAGASPLIRFIDSTGARRFAGLVRRRTMKRSVRLRIGGPFGATGKPSGAGWCCGPHSGLDGRNLTVIVPPCLSHRSDGPRPVVTVPLIPNTIPRPPGASWSPTSRRSLRKRTRTPSRLDRGAVSADRRYTNYACR